MRPVQRCALLLAAAAAAAGLAFVFVWRSAMVPEAPANIVVGVALLAWGMWFVFLSPVWLPAVVSTRWPRVERLVSVTAGVLLLAAVAAWIGSFAVLGGRPSWAASIAAVLAVLIGVWHLTRRSSGTPSAAAEPQH